MVAFLNLTTLTNLETGERLFAVAPGAGAGLRLCINKRSKTNLCFDVGSAKTDREASTWPFRKRSEPAPRPIRDTRLLTRYPTRVDCDDIIKVLRAFEAAGLEYVLIGAAPGGNDDDPRISDITAADLLGDYPAVRYYPPTGVLYFDVLTRLGEAARFETVEAETKVIEGTMVFVSRRRWRSIASRRTRSGPSTSRTPRPCANDSG